MDTLYPHIIAAILGLLLGLWARKLLKAACILFVAAKLVLIGLILLGWAALPDFEHTTVPQIISAVTRVAAALRAVAHNAPAAVLGFLAGIAVREVAIAIRRP